MRLGSALAFCVLSTACGGNEASPGADALASDTGVDSDSSHANLDSTTDESGADALDSRPGEDSIGQSCNSLELSPMVQEMYVATPPPSLRGGNLPDGDYQLTAWYEYTNPGGNTGPTGLLQSIHFRVTGSTLFEASDDGAQQSRTKSETSFTGNEWLWTDACLNPGLKRTWLFDWDGTTLRWALAAESFVVFEMHRMQ